MAKRRSFVPDCLREATLEIRIAPSSWGDIGNWFSSQYNHVKQDLGITHKKAKDPAAGIQQLWNSSNKVAKPAKAHATSSALIHITSNDTVAAK